MKKLSVVPFVKINKVPVYVPPAVLDPLDVNLVEENLASKKEQTKQNIMDYYDVLIETGYFTKENISFSELIPCHVPGVLMIHYRKASPENPYPLTPYCRGIFFDLEHKFIYNSIYPWTPVIQATSFIETIHDENNNLNKYNIEAPPFFFGQENIKFAIAHDEEELETQSNFKSSIRGYLSYGKNSEGKETKDTVQIKASISGTIIRILYINGEIMFTTHRNSNARNASWGGKTFYEIYRDAGGPPLENFYDTTKRYGSVVYVFMIMDPSNLVDLPIYIKSSHLFLLGVGKNDMEGKFSEDELDDNAYDFSGYEMLNLEQIPFDLESINPATIIEENGDKLRSIKNTKKIIKLVGMKYSDINKNLFPEGIEQRIYMDDQSRPIIENSNLLNISTPVILIKSSEVKQDDGEFISIGYTDIVKVANPSVARRIYLRAQCSDPLDSFYNNLSNPNVQFLVNYAGDAFKLENREQTLEKFNKYTTQELDISDIDFPVISALHNFNAIYLTPVEYYDSDILHLSIEKFKFIQPFNVFMNGILERLFEIDNEKIEKVKGKQLYIERRNNRTRYLQYVVYLNLLQSLPAGLQESYINLLENFYNQIDNTVNWFMKHYGKKAVNSFIPQEFLSRKADQLAYTDREKHSANVIAKYANRMMEKAVTEASAGIEGLRGKESRNKKYTSRASKNLIKKKYDYETSDQEEKLFLDYLQNNITRKLIFNPSKNAGIIKRVNSLPI